MASATTWTTASERLTRVESATDLARCTSVDVSPWHPGRATAMATCSTCAASAGERGHWGVSMRMLATTTAKLAAAMEIACTPCQGWIATETSSWWRVAPTAWPPTSTLSPTWTMGAALWGDASCLRRATSIPQRTTTWMGRVSLKVAWGAWTWLRATMTPLQRWEAWPCAPIRWHFTWAAMARA